VSGTGAAVSGAGLGAGGVLAAADGSLDPVPAAPGVSYNTTGTPLITTLPDLYKSLTPSSVESFWGKISVIHGFVILYSLSAIVGVC
jgi:hypothetical protein